MADTPRETSQPRIYRTPSGTMGAHYAGFFQRIAAWVVDWLLSFVLPFILSGVVTNLFRNQVYGTSPQTLDLVGALLFVAISTATVVYFTALTARGRTLGMRMVGTQIVDPYTGAPPAPGRALARSLMVVLFGVSAFTLLSFASSGAPVAELSTMEQVFVASAFVVFIVGMWAHLWMFFNPRGQTAIDRVAGVVVTERLVKIPGASPSSKTAARARRRQQSTGPGSR